MYIFIVHCAGSLLAISFIIPILWSFGLLSLSVLKFVTFSLHYFGILLEHFGTDDLIFHDYYRPSGPGKRMRNCSILLNSCPPNGGQLHQLLGVFQPNALSAMRNFLMQPVLKMRTMNLVTTLENCVLERLTRNLSKSLHVLILLTWMKEMLSKARARLANTKGRRQRGKPGRKNLRRPGDLLLYRKGEN